MNSKAKAQEGPVPGNYGSQPAGLWPSPSMLLATLKSGHLPSGVGLVSGHAEPKSGNQSGGSMGQGSKLRCQDQADLSSAQFHHPRVSYDPGHVSQPLTE